MLPERARNGLAGWKAAPAIGHEAGNYSTTHPCSGNFAFSRQNALDDYTRERLERDLAQASLFVSRELGREPSSFAYPCGQTFVGRGEGVRSYVPMVARLFRTGRLYPASGLWVDTVDAVSAQVLRQRGNRSPPAGPTSKAD